MRFGLLSLLTGVSVFAWIFLLLFRGRFWRIDSVGLPAPTGGPRTLAPLAIIVPARDEVASLPVSLPSLLQQRYAGAWKIVLVDDQSTDGTAELARKLARDAGAADRLIVVAGTALPPVWTGKLWALQQGVEAARLACPDVAWFLFTDADIAQPPDHLEALVDFAQARRCDLVSQMVALRCESFWERLLIPAFVFFFQKLYPFRWVANPSKRTAGAAGGCLLLQGRALERAGGLGAIRGELIDDCALAASVKASGGQLWLGNCRETRSLRAYDSLAEIWRMVSRTAYTQLRYSPALVASSVLVMALLYILPVFSTLAGLWRDDFFLLALGLAAWSLLAFAYLPTVRLYRQSWSLALTLPLAAALYTAMTLDSARRHWQGIGGAWKGRVRGNESV